MIQLPGHFCEGSENIESRFGRRLHEIDAVLSSQSLAIFPINYSIFAITLVTYFKI